MSRVQNLYHRAVHCLRGMRESHPHSGKPLNLEQPLDIIGQLVAEPPLVDEMYQLTVGFGSGDDYEISSPVNTMVLCLKMGMRMGYSPFELTEIGLAALHHDIGLLAIPKAILNKKGELTATEWTEIRKHPSTGRDLLSPHDHDYPNLSRAVHEHHERESGQGYPSGIKGEKICDYAKIIGICDSYEAMTHNRPYKKAIEPHVAVRDLAETKNLLFTPSFLKYFLDEITMYPIGTHVRLNNQSIGIVVATSRSNPFKPTVRLISDGQGNRIMDDRLIDLAGTAILNVVEGIPTAKLPA